MSGRSMITVKPALLRAIPSTSTAVSPDPGQPHDGDAPQVRTQALGENASMESATFFGY